MKKLLLGLVISISSLQAVATPTNFLVCKQRALMGHNMAILLEKKYPVSYIYNVYEGTQGAISTIQVVVSLTELGYNKYEVTDWIWSACNKIMNENTKRRL